MDKIKVSTNTNTWRMIENNNLDNTDWYKDNKIYDTISEFKITDFISNFKAYATMNKLTLLIKKNEKNEINEYAYILEPVILKGKYNPAGYENISVNRFNTIVSDIETWDDFHATVENEGRIIISSGDIGFIMCSVLVENTD